jgi:hypothetical protein
MVGVEKCFSQQQLQGSSVVQRFSLVPGISEIHNPLGLVRVSLGV